jgi:protein-disulfide isomerase
MGVEGTPTIFVNGEPVDTYEASTVAAAIDAAL